MLRTNFKNSLIQSFYDKFSAYSDTKNYVFIGKFTEWYNETSPPTAVDSLQEELNAWKNMLLCKKINADDVVFVIKRINWTFGTVYQEYDDTLDLYSETTPKEFYVLTSANNVYKCIFNNNGAASEYEPNGTSVEEIITQDGYIWKYMYSVRPELEDFLTEEYIPVEYLDELSYTDQRSLQLDVEQDAKANKNGTISNIVLTQVGSAYPFAIDYTTADTNLEEAHVVQANVAVGGTQIRFNTNAGTSQVDDIYNNHYVVYIYSGDGSGQVRTITAYDGDTGTATVDSAFTEAITTSSYYKILPKVEIIGNGSGAVAVTVLNPTTKQVEYIDVINGGSGYKEASVEIKSSKIASSEKTLARVIISPFNGHGSSALTELGCRDIMIMTRFDKTQIQNFNFYNDYRQLGVIQDVEVVGLTEDAQTYTFDIENLNSTTSLVLDGDYSSFITTLQSDPTLTVKQGSDDNIAQAQGTYVSWDSITKTLVLRTVNGKFMPYPTSTAYPLVIQDYPTTGTDTSYTNIDVTKTAPLNYYNNSTFTVNETVIGQTSKSTGTIVSWLPTFFGTDGKLVLKNLKGSFIESYYNDSGTLVNGENLVSFSTVDTNTGITGFNSAKVGVIKNAQRTEVIEGTNTFRAATVLKLARPTGTTTPFTNSDFTEDERIRQTTTGATGYVVGWSVSDNGLTGTLILSGTTGTFSTNSTYRIQRLITGVYVSQDIIISTISLPEVTRYSGKIIYIENIRPVVRGDDQTEEIKIIIGL